MRRSTPVQSPGSCGPGCLPVPTPDVPASELHDLLSRKLAQCGVMFDFLDCVADLKGKEVKRAALNELVECVGSTRGVLIEPVYPDIIRMVSTVPCLSGQGFYQPTSRTPVGRINVDCSVASDASIFTEPHRCPSPTQDFLSLLPLYLCELGRGYLSSKPLAFHGLTQAWAIL